MQNTHTGGPTIGGGVFRLNIGLRLVYGGLGRNTMLPFILLYFDYIKYSKLNVLERFYS